MYLAKLTIENFRCFGAGNNRLELSLRPGLTALVGENDGGKTAIIDALRFVFGTTDQELQKLDPTDFHNTSASNGGPSPEIRIVCKLEGLDSKDRGMFAEHLTYGKAPSDSHVLFIHWTAKDTRSSTSSRTSFIRPDVRSGEDGRGPTIPPNLRDLLRATYLRPLRNAEQALSAGRGSRVSQVLDHTEDIKSIGVNYDRETGITDPATLNLLGIVDFANHLIEKQAGVLDARNKIDSHLEELSLEGDSLKSRIEVGGANEKEALRLKQLLEKLDLGLVDAGKPGLGSNSLLFIACELLLLVQQDERTKLLLLEEPEAHLHAQRQLRVMKFMQEVLNRDGNTVQVIITTHSPNLASAIELGNLVIVRKGKAFSLAQGQTELEGSDYRFLQRFLDVTKANLFFARGVMIVEGDAENLLIPTLAKIMGKDFTTYGISIVNVGGVGLRRYARIFQRRNVENGKELDIRVACVTDMDVMPDCAPTIIGKLKDTDDWPPLDSKRRWRAKRDVPDLQLARNGKRDKAMGQCVKTFVSDEWTFEYDLALGPKDGSGRFPGGLAQDVFVAASLAEKDEKMSRQFGGDASDQQSLLDENVFQKIEATALKNFADLTNAVSASATTSCVSEEIIASHVYAKFESGSASKAIAAQYLAERLLRMHLSGELTAEGLRGRLPTYLVDAIDFVTSGSPISAPEVVSE
jgi:putative ATP-dependent endonuclease of the OLD family